MPGATRRPRITLAALRKSSMREFVQLPMNTTSTRWPMSGCPGRRSMYRSAFSREARAAESVTSAGSGTREPTGNAIPGLVPYVIIGSRVEPSMRTTRSYAAPGSLGSWRHLATAASHSAPVGRRGVLARYSNVVSSGAIIPARAPASMDMLQTVIRCSIESARTALPVNSMT